MAFLKLSLKPLETLLIVCILSQMIFCIEVKDGTQLQSEILSGASLTKVNDLKTENSHGYGYYGPGIGLGHSYQLGYPEKRPYYPNYYPGYTGKPALGLGGYYNPSFGYSFGLGSGFGIGYPGYHNPGYNPGYTHHPGALAHYGYPFVG